MWLSVLCICFLLRSFQLFRIKFSQIMHLHNNRPVVAPVILPPWCIVKCHPVLTQRLMLPRKNSELLCWRTYMNLITEGLCLSLQTVRLFACRKTENEVPCCNPKKYLEQWLKRTPRSMNSVLRSIRVPAFLFQTSRHKHTDISCACSSDDLTTYWIQTCKGSSLTCRTVKALRGKKTMIVLLAEYNAVYPI